MQFTRLAEMLGAGTTLHPMGSRSPGLMPDGGYSTLDGVVFVTAYSDAQWRGFCIAIERPGIAVAMFHADFSGATPFRASDPADPRYNWAALDLAVSIVRTAGLRVMLSVTGPGPTWTSTAPRR